MSGHTGPSTLVSTQSDPVLSKFSAEPFDAAAYTSGIVRSSSVADALTTLARGLQHVDHELNAQVAAHHEELLGQVSNVKQLENMLQVVRSGVDSLQASIDKVSNEIREPAAQIQQRTGQLGRLQEAAELVRRVGRYMHECGRLRAHLSSGGPRDLAKAAQSLLELERLAASPPGALQGVAVVDAEVSAVSEARLELQRRAQQLLVSGVQQLDASETAAAVDVLDRLQRLPDRCDALRDQEVRQLRDVWRTALAQAQPSPSSQPPAAAAAAATGESSRLAAAGLQQPVWSALSKALDALHSASVRVWHLDGVVAARWQQQQRGPAGAGLHQLMAANAARAEMPGRRTAASAAAGAAGSGGPAAASATTTTIAGAAPPSVAGRFWREALQQAVQAPLAQALREGPPALEQALVADYPRLHRLFAEALQRLQQHFELRHRPLSADEQSACFAAVRTLQDAYVARAFGRLSDAVQRAFAPAAAAAAAGSGGAPSADDTATVAALVAHELELGRAAGVPGGLDAALRAAASKALKLFAAKAEPLIGSDATAYALPSDQPPSPVQQRNAKLFGRLQQLYTATMAALDGHTPPEPLFAALEKLRSVATEILGALCQQLSRQFDGSMLLMLREDFSMKEASEKESASGSKYMQTLAAQIARAQPVLGQYAVGPWRQPPLTAVAARLVDQFVRLATLLRPLGEGGKLKLTQDMIRLELAVAPLAPAKELGTSYAALRALRPLLFRETAAIPDAADSAHLPLSALLNHVISRAGPGMPSVHAWNQWSLTQYAQWLETHSDADACALIRRALEGYVQQVNQRGERQFDAVYPILVRLLESRR